MTAKDKIEELALKVANDALAESVTLEVRLEALKILNPHYTMLLKSKAKSEDDRSERNFDDFAEALNGDTAKN